MTRNLKEQTIGYVDALGNFILNLRDHHVDPYNPESLGFFKKMSYNDKMKEFNDSLLTALDIMRDVSDTE